MRAEDYAETPATRSPTIKDVAEHAGVAASTVSRVLNNHRDVSHATRVKVFRSIESLGYEPNLIASGLRSGRSFTIGCIVSNIHNPLYARVVSAAQHLLQQEGYGLLLANSDNDPEQDTQIIRTLSLRRVDALVASVANETNLTTVEALSSFPGPIVLLDRTIPGLSDVSVVEVDHYRGMREAVCHLLELGHERIAFLTSPLEVRPSSERLRAFRDEFAKHGVAVPEDLVCAGLVDTTSARACALNTLQGPGRPTALITGGILIFVGTMRALSDLGLRAGRDISMISCDDIPLAELHTPAISVVARDNDELGRTAAQLALDRLTDSVGTGETVTLPTRMLWRESTFENSQT